MNDYDDARVPPIQVLLDELLDLRAAIVDESVPATQHIGQAHAFHRDSVTNLLHYLALRRRDLRPLQRLLAEQGLSSLGRAEAHVLATIDAVLSVLHRLAGRSWRPDTPGGPPIDFQAGQKLLCDHADAVLGSTPQERGVRIMVTMPDTAADDYRLVEDLLARGMDCIRINCAHDDPATWLRIIENLRRAEKTLGRSCRVAMDLGGPKLRTGPIEAGPAVVKLRPARDAFGHVTAPARIWLSTTDEPQESPSGAAPCLSVPAAWLARLAQGHRVKLTDARGSKRTLAVVEVLPHGCWLETEKTVYFTEGTTLRHDRPGAKGRNPTTRLTAVPSREGFIRLGNGERLVLTRDDAPGRAACRDDAGQVVSAATMGCTLPQIFDDVRQGESIYFDDGKIGGVIEDIDHDHMHILITQAPPGGTKLRADKGINLPDSALRLPALTGKDIEDLAFVVEHADIVQLSFPNSAEDVASLQEHIARLGDKRPAIVLKIETRRGFENLPEMLLMALRSPRCGVMIARGDLAVECGFERLAEVQEEILWICEAAHVPVVWATQVLETMAKEGIPSRAEVTDAAMAHRAECVMLNKGPYIIDAVRVLDDILRRMQGHQTKKQSMLRMLQLACDSSDSSHRRFGEAVA